jgi:hypothetical protein
MQQQQGTTIAQKIEIGANIAFTVCFPVMPLLRRKLGYRFISLPRLLIMLVVLWVAGTFFAFSSIGRNIWLLYLFALAFLVVGIVARQLRWNDIKKGIPWHSRSRGISWFNSFLPFSDSVVKRFVDPASVFIVGLLFAFVLQPLLGYYLLAAAVCMFAWESYDYQRSIDLMLDQLDALVDSEVISENVEYYQQPNPRQRPLEETAGIPTGVAPDLQAALERRRNRAALSPSAAAALTAQTVVPPTQAVPSFTVYPPPGAPSASTAAGPALDNLVLPDDTTSAP